MKTKKLGMLAIAMLVILAGSMVAGAGPFYNYDRTKAANYATANWNKGVPGSWYFGGIFQADCTNFASNVLNVGGVPMLYFDSSYGWYLKDNRWPWKPAHSPSWSAAKNFGIWLTTMGVAKKVTMYNKPWSNYMRIGDIVQVDEDGNGYGDHTMIVTGVSSTNLYMTYHSNDRLNRPLTEVLSEFKKDDSRATLIGYKIVD
jgi:hypothetical protein